ncbi:MAG: hypothetical protein ACOY99_12850 [Pseudomonadota bacterium]|jgi:tetratricopeptide (TPR) repeat protein
MMRRPLAALFLVLASLGPAMASHEAALALYAEGRYAAAAALARTLNTADGWALAARAELVVAAYLSDDDAAAQNALEAAIADGGRALELAPGHMEGLLQSAIAIGYKARLTHSTALAREARALIDRAMAQAPGDAYALAVLGGWHGETVAVAGGFLAKLTTGADKQGFTSAFEAALVADPANPAIRAYYGRLLLDIGGKDFTARAGEVLGEALALSPRDAFEAMMQDETRTLVAALESGDRKRLKATVKSLTPFAHGTG